MAYIATPDLIIRVEPHCQILFVVGPLVLPKKNYPCKCTISLEVYAEEARKPTLHIITLTCRSMAYNSNHSISFFILLWFILFHFSHLYDYCKIVEGNFNFVAQERTQMVFPKPWVKHSLEFSRFFSFLYQFINLKKKTRWQLMQWTNKV